MRLHLCVVGRLRAGPERELIDGLPNPVRQDRGARWDLARRPSPKLRIRKGGGMTAEAALLSRAIPDGAVICALDERRKQMSSPDFAHQLGRWRDDGRGDLACLIGGADGLDASLVARADLTLSLGPYGLAAYAGARDADRTIVPRSLDPGRCALSPRLNGPDPVAHGPAPP